MNRKRKWGNSERTRAVSAIMAMVLVWGYAPASLCVPIIPTDTFISCYLGTERL